MLVSVLRTAWPALLLCALPWAWPLFYYFNPRLHPDAEYMHFFSRFGLWSLCVAAGGIALASWEIWRSRSPLPGVGVACAFAYILWFPWSVLPAMLKL